MCILKNFSSVSGLTVNYDKSYLFPLGSLVNLVPVDFHNLGFKITHHPVKTLGVYISHNNKDFFILNYLPKLSRHKSLLQIWSQRDLTPNGKITIVKTFGLSQLVFLLSVLPSSPTSFSKEVERAIFNFIWSGKPAKYVDLHLLYQSILEV